MLRALLLLYLASFTGCFVSCKKAADKPEPMEPAGEDQLLYAQAATRLVRDFVDEGGWVVSRHVGSNAAAHEGDSLIWSGLALHALDCVYGRPISDGLLGAVNRLSGGIYRHPSIPDDVSLDGAIGMWRGALKRATVCGDASWADALSQQARFMVVHDGQLNPSSRVVVPYPWNVLHEYVLHAVGVLKEAPSGDRKAMLEAAVVTWAAAVAASGRDEGSPAEVKKAACFRVHLGLQTLKTLEDAGATVAQKTRDRFCSVTEEMKLPTVDHWCGRTGLLEFIEGFAYDTWEYRHQRCPGWEKPDADGLRTPGLDLLTAYADLYGLGQQ
jgi:hypothetical protein